MATPSAQQQKPVVQPAGNAPKWMLRLGLGLAGICMLVGIIILIPWKKPSMPHIPGNVFVSYPPLILIALGIIWILLRTFLPQKVWRALRSVLVFTLVVVIPWELYTWMSKPKPIPEIPCGTGYTASPPIGTREAHFKVRPGCTSEWIVFPSKIERWTAYTSGNIRLHYPDDTSSEAGPLTTRSLPLQTGLYRGIRIENLELQPVTIDLFFQY